MIPEIFKIYIIDISIILFLAICSYALTKGTNEAFKAMPDRLGKIFRMGLPGTALRWVSSFWAFGISILFNVQTVTKIFGSYNEMVSTKLSSFFNHVIVASLIFVFSGLINEIIEGYLQKYGKKK